MKNILYTISMLVLIIFILPFVISCGEQIDDYVVQIWRPAAVSGEPETLLAFGIVVDGGNHVLTVLDYEEDTPNRLLVISPEYGQFDASIQAVDYRTSATLLQLQDANLPAAEIGDTSSLKSNQRVTIRGWGGADDEYMKTPADTRISDNLSPLFFSVSLSQGVADKGRGWVDEPGAVITDKNGKVIGLLGRYWSKLIIKLGGPGIVNLPLAVSIDGAMELLTDSSYTNGPSVSVVLTRLGSTDFVPGDAPHLPINNIENLDATIIGLLNNLGKPLSLDDLLKYSSGLSGSFHPEKGVMLITAFTYPVALCDSDGNLLASAKWVGIQWNRGGDKPNRLIYGATTYVIDGAYSIEGDISDLLQLIEPIVL